MDIYFATPTFDEITKDLKSSFMLKISTIGRKYLRSIRAIRGKTLGGTMGLFTGFSIISGVEIIFFALKIAKELIFRRKKD